MKKTIKRQKHIMEKTAGKKLQHAVQKGKQGTKKLNEKTKAVLRKK